ncbi:MAG: hypothetical protein PVS3B3_37780 [Ktedonobacteraceae bacterium]
MRKSIHGMSAIFLTLIALCVFLCAVTTSFAHDASTPPGFLYESHGFGLHGGIHPLSHSYGLLPANALPNTSVVSSSNWAGFYVGTGLGSGFKQVIGSWHTPCISGPINRNHLVAQWVGIGGVYGSQHLLQVGTALLTDGRFHPFYELFPNPPMISNQSFSCGNAFTAEVDYNFYSRGTNKNHIFIKNISTGFTLDHIVPDSRFKPDMQSAEWIDERPSCSRSLADLANFHYVGWTNLQARSNSNGAGLSGIGSFANSTIVMQDNKQHTLAKPDGLNPNNTFKDRWYNAGSDGSC